VSTRLVNVRIGAARYVGRCDVSLFGHYCVSLPGHYCFLLPVCCRAFFLNAVAPFFLDAVAFLHLDAVASLYLDAIASRPPFPCLAAGDVEALASFPEAFAANTQFFSQFSFGELILIVEYEAHEVVFERGLIGVGHAVATRVLFGLRLNGEQCLTNLAIGVA